MILRFEILSINNVSFQIGSGSVIAFEPNRMVHLSNVADIMLVVLRIIFTGTLTFTMNNMIRLSWKGCKEDWLQHNCRGRYKTQ